MKPKILLLDTIADEGVAAIGEFAAITDGRTYDKKRILEEIAQFDGVVIKSNNWITADIIEKASRLRVIGRAGSGSENIDLEAAAAKNIQVITSPEGNVCSAAEYVLCMMILLSHQLHEAHLGSRRNDFRRQIWQGRNIKELTLGVIGLGNIGQGVVEKAAPLCKNIIGYDPYVDALKIATPENFSRTNHLTTLLQHADVLTLHMPLTPETRKMFNRQLFAQVKKGCILINSSRGLLIDDEALLEAFSDGRVSFAALDSLYPDPEYNRLPEDTTYSHFLVHHPKVYYTPHIAAGSRDALRDVACNMVNKMKEVLINKVETV
ncbi:D-isomer specific 2-hydroxyacid dehydrogenase family protein [[Flexibacter] sp. ATCC 35208]|uniref:NAD(P)-dependent oxidoreductase n=1 Tax=[Flexibacter] sp. ATCC 35208 TaxID=1936242 RepID=UPI0009C7E076|nr:NAD(P)-dependent oxidoreductase [[Flexibacter] sp. ATCC 35208]OMP77914.1 hypothetical protein BW716_17720 [[Flexibacter] sp. ATCC 35208]